MHNRCNVLYFRSMMLIFFYVGRMQGETIIAMKDVSSMTFILHVFSKNNHSYHFFLFIAKFINTSL